ncbi:HlyC/CorC family transporter [endosymbiont of Ridgeia piscesae]|jgi:magnesium and cobalt transporter|uniref:Magnesium and cobalt efflux protein CorC n=1 Tax=endosymbiont of Ridgeia piscesae TaxID=54398 RepID=A0A0T5Z675_9GAMM|nr:transporter associated domain-containing protein [endosymbiont of Ridgeia piscesae]KRT53875.1 Mg2+ and Co2+ transporter CorC [endosymbiont of Ridgeia piscesae]KRT58086.1 magnesium and cobalt transporter [endosymbiont of Ridgeia piscesae]
MSSKDRPMFGSFQAWLKRISQRFRSEPEDKAQLVELLQESNKRRLLDHDTLSMIEGAMQVSEMRVRDIMVPRAEMVVLRRDDTLEEILPVAVESAHSRFPVIGDDKGEVVGILLAKDLLAWCQSADQRRFQIRDLLRSAVFVPESKRLNVLLQEFRASRNHMAIVIDEYGAAAGLVTIEDVLEQIVGEIEDEHDYDEGGNIFRRSNQEYMVKARTEIGEFNDCFDSNLQDDEFDTVGGLVVNAFGHLPKKDESVDIGRFRFRVMRADSRRLHLLSLTLLQSASPPQEE